MPKFLINDNAPPEIKEEKVALQLKYSTLFFGQSARKNFV